MTSWPWVGLAIIAGLVALDRWVHGRELIRRAEIIAGLKAAQDHTACLDIMGRQWEELDRVQHELAIERGQAMVAEVEQYLQEHDG